MVTTRARVRWQPLVAFVVVVVGCIALWNRRAERLQPVDPVGDSARTANGERAPVSSSVIPQGHVYTGVAEEPNDLNPFTTSSGVARRFVMGFTHDTLLDLDPVTGALRGALATAYDVDADGLAMTVTIRTGVTFSDGSPLTVDDVMFTHDIAKARGVVLGSLADGIRLCKSAARVEGRSDQVRIEFVAPHFAAARAVGESWIVVSKRWWIERLRELATRQRQSLPNFDDPAFGALLAQLTQSPGPGTGPYSFSEATSERPSWRRGIDLTVRRNDTSWRRGTEGHWNLDGIRVRFLAEPAARYAALKKRELDWYSAPELLLQLERDPDLAADYRRLVYDMPSLGAYLVQWNVNRPELQDPRVRTALGMLFDRQGISDRLFAGVARPAAAFAKPDQPGYPKDLAPLPYDPQGARALLRSTGFDPEQQKPLRVRLMVPSEAPWFRRIGELCADAAMQAGVELDLSVLPFKELMERRDGGDWDGALILVSMPTFGDPFELFHSSGGRNAGAYKNEEVDQLLSSQRLERDPVRRAELLERCHRLLANDQPCALLVHPLVEVLIDRRLEGVEVGPLGLWPERMWMPTEYQRR
ncbi:MAG: ABC transporter substrate-binding protein [Planctomycetota bacterium]